MTLKVLIVGRGFAGTLHGEAWKRLNFEVRYYDIVRERSDFDSFENALKVYDPDIVDFCDTPFSRVRYCNNYEELLRGRLIIFEKPPCRPQDVNTFERLARRLTLRVVHNYLYYDELVTTIKRDGHLVVQIYRTKPHKDWYVDPLLTGCGIVCDHGYHWIYLAYYLLDVDPETLDIKLDGVPDYTCTITGRKVYIYATWKANVRKTIVNGMEWEPYQNCEERMVQSFARFFTSVMRLDGEVDNPEIDVRIMLHIANVVSRLGTKAVEKTC